MFFFVAQMNNLVYENNRCRAVEGYTCRRHLNRRTYSTAGEFSVTQRNSRIFHCWLHVNVNKTRLKLDARACSEKTQLYMVAIAHRAVNSYKPVFGESVFNTELSEGGQQYMWAIMKERKFVTDTSLRYNKNRFQCNSAVIIYSDNSQFRD